MVIRGCIVALLAAATGTVDGAELAELVKVARVAIVRIEASGADGGSLGSGFVVREDGVVATNYHVVKDASRAKVVFEDGRSYDVSGILVSRPDHDMVLLKVECDGKLPVLPLCERLPEQGEDVFTFGNPEGLRFVVTKGVVSAIADTLDIMHGVGELAVALDGMYSRDAVWIQTDAPISHGNSGGPLIDMQGRVVGLNTWGWRKGQNLNFAGSALTLAKMVKLATEKLTPLPGRRLSAAPAERPRVRAAVRTVELPDGRVLDLDGLGKQPANPVGGKVGENLLEIPHPDGETPFASLRVNEVGKLHGICTAQHANGTPMVAGRYVDGKREGSFRWTSAEGTILLDAQFRGGKEHGLVCYYDGGDPALVRECAAGTAQWSHRLEDGKVVESVDHAPGKPVTASPAMTKLLDSYTEFARELRQNEHGIKEMVREIVDDVRRQRAAARGAMTTQMMLQRMGERAAQEAAVMGALRSRSGF